MDAYWTSRLSAISTTLNQLQIDDSARCYYELMSNAMVWSDEVPCEAITDPKAYSVLRCLFRYRTSLILESTDLELEPFWRLGLELFPKWPGFLEKRHEPSLSVEYHKLKSQPP